MFIEEYKTGKFPDNSFSLVSDWLQFKFKMASLDLNLHTSM